MTETAGSIRHGMSGNAMESQASLSSSATTRRVLLAPE